MNSTFFNPFSLVTTRFLTLLTLTFAGLVTASAQTPTDLYNFKGGTTDVSGPVPFGIMGQGRDGNLYSVSPSGGAHGNGTVFVASPSGTESLVYSFLSGDGSACQPGITLGSDGNFYGDCHSGGPNGGGTLYRVTPTGTFTILHSFPGAAGDGSQPNGPPMQASDGNFYGMTELGGAHGNGTVYKLTPGGTLTILYSFTGATDGSQPSPKLVQGTDGNLYGGSQFGGANNAGTIFKVSTAGKLTVLHAFTGADGNRLIGGLIQGTNGNFYGTTYSGGANNQGVVFKMTAGGALTVLHSFLAATDGSNPEAALVQATDGNFYGVANPNTGATPTSLYKVTLKGVFSVVYLFNGTVGQFPAAGLVQNTDGLLYGDTTGGGTGNNGIFYSLNIGAAPFLRLALTSGKAGDLIGMFGQGFSSSSVVKFGGVAATSITLTGSTYIVATVPVGALTGSVTVTTGSTTLTSSKIFTVHDSWTGGAALPTAVAGPANGAIGTKVYIVGGVTSSAVVNINQIYNTATNKWTTGAPMPTARFVAASAVVNNILYVIGGCDSGCATGVGAKTAVEAYNPTTNTWSTKAPLPTATDSVTAVAASGFIYVIGGYVPGVGRVGTVFRYNPALDAWSTEAPLLVAKSDANVGLLGSTIVATGGLSSSGFTGDNEGFSASKNLWTTLVADPTARSVSCTAAITGQLYVGGGSNGAALNVLESFNATTKKWTTLAPMPLAVVAPGNATVGNLLYCFGGSSTGGIFTGTVYNNVQIYRP